MSSFFTTLCHSSISSLVRFLDDTKVFRMRENLLGYKELPKSLFRVSERVTKMACKVRHIERKRASEHLH